MHIDMQPQMGDNRPDNEGAMAKADLYKLANYSLKLFKMMDGDTQLEGWVQAKITKAADYIASVYHYLEYEMKFSEYGQAIDDSDMYSESQKRELKAKLLEAKEKIKDLKKAQAEKLKEARATDKKKGAVTKSEKSQYHVKTTKGSSTYGRSWEADEGETEGDTRDRIESDAKSKGETVHSIRKKEVAEAKSKKAKKDYDKDGKIESEKDEVIGSRRKAAGLDEAAKPDYIDLDKDGNKKEPMKKAAKDKKVKEASEKCNHTPKGKSCPVHGLKECGGMYEASKPSAGLSKEKKSAVVKKAKAGGDIGKPGKNFGKVAAAAKKGGAKDPEAVAAAAMWKNQAR